MKYQTKLWALALFMMSGGFANAQKEWQADSLELFQIDEDSHLRGGAIRQTSGYVSQIEPCDGGFPVLQFFLSYTRRINQ